MAKAGCLFLCLNVFLALNIQSQTFTKIISNYTSSVYTEGIIQGSDNHYYMTLANANMDSMTVNYKCIIELDEMGNKLDSVQIDTIFGKQNLSTSGIENNGNNFFYYSLLSDNTHHYLYARIFGNGLHKIDEKIVDTLQFNEYIIWHIKNKNGHHLFLTGVYQGVYFDYFIYETDAELNLLRKVNTGFSDGGPHSEIFAVNIVDLPVDSSYILTSYNWNLRTDYNFSSFDTICHRNYPAACEYNNTLKYNDSTYFENVLGLKNAGLPYMESFGGLLVHSVNATVVDTIPVITPMYDNEVTSFRDFLSFLNPDTLFYCAPVKKWNQYDKNVVIVKMDRHGNILWQKYFDLHADILSGSIAATNDGGCIVQWSYFWDTGLSAKNLILIKTDKNGNVATGIEGDIAQSDHQVMVYPNPASTNIYFEIGMYANLHLQIFNSLGGLQLEKELSQGSNGIDISSYSSGMYFYRILYKGKFLEDGKLIKD